MLRSGALVIGGLFLVGTAIADVEFVGVDSKAKLIAGDTGAVVTGSVVCTLGDLFSATAIISQNHGNVNVTGQNLSAPDTACTGAPQPFTAAVQVVIPPNEKFKKGPATLILNVSSHDVA